FWLETRADGWRRVRASHADPVTRVVVDEPPGAWEPPPRRPGAVLAGIEAIERRRDAERGRE
ncbi:MAG TPA: hypothetical protein VF474_04350, partial [Phenylobacterium sp.]